MKKMSKTIIWSVSLVVIILVVFIGSLGRNDAFIPANSDKVNQSSKTTTTKKQYQETTITIGNVGDILIHSPIFRSVYNSQSNE